MTPPIGPPGQRAMEKRHSTTREYLEALLIAVIFLGFTNGFLIKTFYIPSASMEDTLLIGDHLFVNRFVYGSTQWDWERRLLPLRSPHRGDIVIFKSPERPAVDMVKRCIGLFGVAERIEVRPDLPRGLENRIRIKDRLSGAVCRCDIIGFQRTNND